MDSECFVCLEEANTVSPCRCKLPLHHHCYLNLIEYNKSVCAICNEDMYYMLEEAPEEKEPVVKILPVPCIWRTGPRTHWCIELFYILAYYTLIYIIVDIAINNTIALRGISLFLALILFICPCILKL